MPQFDILSFINQSFYLFCFFLLIISFLFQYFIPAFFRPLYIRSKYYLYLVNLQSKITSKRISLQLYLKHKFKNYFIKRK